LGVALVSTTLGNYFVLQQWTPCFLHSASPRSHYESWEAVNFEIPCHGGGQQSCVQPGRRTCHCQLFRSGTVFSGSLLSMPICGGISSIQRGGCLRWPWMPVSKDTPCPGHCLLCLDELVIFGRIHYQQLH
jgi:hypothetical protein